MPLPEMKLISSPDLRSGPSGPGTGSPCCPSHTPAAS
jgi:hypothetical protein